VSDNAGKVTERPNWTLPPRGAGRGRRLGGATSGGTPPRLGRHCAGGAAGAAGAAAGAGSPPPCFTSRFSWRHSARLFSSPALQSCFASRPASRSSRRSSRRSPPCVSAYAGTTPASATTAANAHTALRNVIFRRILVSPFGLVCSTSHHLVRYPFRPWERNPSRPPSRSAPRMAARAAACDSDQRASEHRGRSPGQPRSRTEREDGA